MPVTQARNRIGNYRTAISLTSLLIYDMLIDVQV